jgi:hypothetical protein
MEEGGSRFEAGPRKKHKSLPKNNLKAEGMGSWFKW